MSISWDFPYPSQRMPILARNMVATSQPLATQAGCDALRRGGNAIDAALAAAITLTVVEPCNNGLGSDAFAMIWDGHQLHGLNASGRAPAAWHAARFAGRTRMPGSGWDSVTVPGAVSAWVALSERFGRLPFADLFNAAIAYARDGFAVAPKTAYYWGLGVAQHQKRPDFMTHFAPGGRAPRAGDLYRSDALAETLATIAASRGESFYRGELARRMVAHSADEGGALSARDLDEHTVTWDTPLAQRFYEWTAHEIPPNGQGLAALIALALIERGGVARYPLDSVDSIHLQIEAMKIAIATAFRYFADPNAMEAPYEHFLNADWLDGLASCIDMGQARTAVSPPLPSSEDTVYLCSADADGRMVSFIQSNFRGFGSGVVVPNTGISLQNRGSGFSLDPSHPNCVAPRKRPYHTIIPGFVTAAGRPLLSFGVMGGHMQHQGHVQMIVRVCLHGQNPQTASDAPRWHVYEDLSVGVERGFPAALVNDLKSRGHAVRYEEQEHVFGGAQLIYRLANGFYVGASDHRKEGQAAGF